jgi:hypothetical protein
MGASSYQINSTWELLALFRRGSDTAHMQSQLPSFVDGQPARWLRRLLAGGISFALLITSSIALAANAPNDTLRIGSKRFTESYILAQVLAQTAAAHTPTPPSVLQGLGNTAIVYEALQHRPLP